MIAGTTFAPSAAPVALNFQHALSRIFVQATSQLNQIAVVKGLTLKNLNSAGTITGTPAAEWTWEWTSSTPIDYRYQTIPAAVIPRSGTALTSMEQGMMVLPQKIVNANDDVTTGDFALEVLYDLENLKDQVAHVYLPNNYEFEMGKQYIINVTFNETVTNLIEINFNIDVTPWEYQLINPSL